MPNRLAKATSPYLLQHQDNPVDWWEWGEEPFEVARQRNVPILLSVGYAACHWCHVMAHESFEDEATAAYLNEHYVSIKVDREERPDVDAVYMQATVAMTGQGGWPMTCVLDHEGSPFFAGTYFPDQPRHGQPSFRQLLEAIDDAWTNRFEEVTAASTGSVTRSDAAVELSGGVAFDEAALDGRGRAGARVRRRLGRVRRRAEVPAVDGAGVPAADGATARPDGRQDTGRDGGRRDPRPAGRRLRAVRRRPCLGGAALREDALRQRAAALGLRPLGRAARGRAGRRGRARDRGLHAHRARHRARVRSPPRWTPTPRGRRAPSTCGPRPSWPRCSVPTTVRGRRSC